MKEKFFASILIGTLVISAFSGCGNSAQESTEAMAPSIDITAGTGTNEAEETARTEEDAGAKAEEEAAAKAAEEEAARQEEANTYYETGRAYLYGLDGKEFNLEAAYTNFEKALELEKTEANFYLGLLYDWYGYPEKDYEKAVAYYEAAGDDPYAQLALGYLYYFGDGVEEDKAKAQEIYESVIAEGYVEGYLGIGDIANDDGDYVTAFECYNKVLGGKEQAYVAAAMYSIGYMYDYRQGVEQDYAQAMEWYEKAAILGESNAMNNIGYLYMNGLGVEQDYTTALEWYMKAADLGNSTAMANIGYMYYNGLGVEQNYTTALEWNMNAADLGDSIAMTNIGYMYENGLGVEQDLEKAQEWYDKAVAE